MLLAVAHLVHHREPRDGMVLGAIVGAGFAAFESSGYALQTILDHIDERPVFNILETELFRALLAPFGHISWRRCSAAPCSPARVAAAST